MAFTQVTDPVDNITNQPNQPIIGAAALKALFDETGKDLKTYINNVLLVELEKITDGDSGADNIGFTPISGGVANTVQGGIEEVNAKVISLLPFPDGSITNPKLATDVKVGSLATLLTTTKASVVAAINELLTPTVVTINSGFAAGWSGTIVIRKSLFNLVQITIDLTKSTDMTVGALTIATLPLGVRPLLDIDQCIFTLDISDTPTIGSFTRLLITNDGNVIIVPYGTVLNARKTGIRSFVYYSE